VWAPGGRGGNTGRDDCVVLAARHSPRRTDRGVADDPAAADSPRWNLRQAPNVSRLVVKKRRMLRRPASIQIPSYDSHGSTKTAVDVLQGDVRGGGAVADRYATTRRRVRDQPCRVRISVTPRADQPRRCANRQPTGRVKMTPRLESSRRLRLTPASPRWGFLLTAPSAIHLQRISEAGTTG
jgi:hypothetical protein